MYQAVYSEFKLVVLKADMTPEPYPSHVMSSLTALSSGGGGGSGGGDATAGGTHMPFQPNLSLATSTASLLLGENSSSPGEGNGTKPYQDFYDNAQFVTGLIGYPTMCAFGLTGNIFILIVFAQKPMSTSTNVFLSALAVSDIVKLVNDLLYFLTVLLLRTNKIAGNRAYGYLYPYAHFFFNSAVCVSSWLTVSVAIERYILVCHPTRSKTWTSMARSKYISTACFIIMTGVAIPSALRYETIETIEVIDGHNVTMLEVCLTPLWKDQTFVVSYTWVQSLLRSIIPLVILIFSSIFIINALRQTRANKKMASRNKITIMLIIVIVFFVICIIPDAIMSAFFGMGYTEADNYLVKGVREITDMLLGVNAAINFALYMIFNKLFRDQFVTLFCRRCARCIAECHTSSSKVEEAQYRRLSCAEMKTCTNGALELPIKTIRESTI